MCVDVQGFPGGVFHSGDQFETKHGRVTVKVIIQVFCINVIIRDSKGDAVINACNRNFQHTEKYQLEDMDWRMMKSVVEDYILSFCRSFTFSGARFLVSILWCPCMDSYLMFQEELVVVV